MLCTSWRLQYSILIGASERNSFPVSSQTSLQHTQISLVLCTSRGCYNTQFLLVLHEGIRFQVGHRQACSILSSHWWSVLPGCGYNTRFLLVLQKGIRFQLVHRHACSILKSHWCSVHPAAATILNSHWCFMKGIRFQVGTDKPAAYSALIGALHVHPAPATILNSHWCFMNELVSS